MGKGRWQTCSANCNHREPQGQQLEPENQRELSEPCALQGARTVHRGGKGREAPTYPNLAFTGPKAEAEEIKQWIAAFLREELGLHLSEEKTRITHARTSAARFLAYEITTLQSNAKQSKTKAGFKRLSINGRIGLRVPQAVLTEKRNRYQRGNKAIHRAELLTESDYTIIATYQLEYRGIANYYHCAYTMEVLNSLKWTMEQSLTKTLANKHKTTVADIYTKYKTHLNLDGKTYKVLQATVPREGKKPKVSTWGAIPLKWEVKTPLEDQPQRQVWNDRSELERRLLAQICEYCGATRLTETLEVHHTISFTDRATLMTLESPVQRNLHAGFGGLRHEVAHVAVEPEQTGLNPMFCHRYPTRTCVRSNPRGGSSWDNVASLARGTVNP
jgi:hypothetical protein